MYSLLISRNKRQQQLKAWRLLLVFTAVFMLLASPFSAIAQTVDPGFNPNKLVEDTVFADIQTFGGPEGVQKFLESKQSVLANTSPTFLAMLKEPDSILLKQGLDDPHPSLGRLRSAAELIWDASQSSGLNPQVILVTLNKEQSLITGRQNDSTEQLQRALDFAMGFDCPDSSGCGSLFPGFYYQLFGNFDSSGNRYLGAVKSLMKSYSQPSGRGPAVGGKAAQVGDTIVLDNTLGGYDGIASQQTVTFANKATTALYRYTPHVFNGNYNFWKFFNAWFRYPNGTLLKLTGDANTYIIQNGLRQVVPAFVAAARSLDLSKTITVSPNELQSYTLDKVYGPADNTVVQVSGDTQLYVFINNVKHPASQFVIAQRGLSQNPVLPVAAADAQLFEQGSILTPTDGTVLRGQNNPEIYLVANGNLQLFSPFTFAQRSVSKKVQLVSDAEIATYPKLGFVPPLDGTLVKAKSATTVYLIDQGFKRPVSGTVFKNRGFTTKQVVVLSDNEVTGLTIGAFATPKNNTYFKTDAGILYVFKDGSKHPISSFVAKQKSITPDVTFSSAEATEWQDGISIPPRDATVVKGDSDQTVYLVSKGQLRPLTAAAFKARRISAKSVKTLPQTEIDGYAKGDTLNK